jgi:hypothetical protein
VVLVLFSYLGCITSNFLTCVPLTKYWSVSEYPKIFIHTFELTFSTAGCSDSDNLHRSDISIRVATALDVFADLLSMFASISS